MAVASSIDTFVVVGDFGKADSEQAALNKQDYEYAP